MDVGDAATEVVDVGVTRHEHADEILDASPPQLEAKDGRVALVFETVVYVGQNSETDEVSGMKPLRQLSWLQFGATTEGVAVAVVIGVSDDESFL